MSSASSSKMAIIKHVASKYASRGDHKNEAGPSRPSRPSTKPKPPRPSSSTDAVYVMPAFRKVLLGCTLYRCLREYWTKNGKPFLQRTLLYELWERPKSRNRKRRMAANIERVIKRRKLMGNDTLTNFLNQKLVSNVEWKPFSTKVVFESIQDNSGAVGMADVEMCLLSANELGVVTSNISWENGITTPFSSRVSLPRNPHSNSAGTTNGHISPSITVPLVSSLVASQSSSVYQQSNGHLSQTWLLFRCKLPLPRTSRKGLRDSAQRRCNATLAPMKSDYCYGCLEIGENTSDDCENGAEIMVFMKRLPAVESEEVFSGKGRTNNGRIANGRVLNGGTTTTENTNIDIAHMLKELLADTDDNIEEADLENMPQMKLRVYQTCIQERRRRESGMRVPPRLDETQIRRARIELIIDRLPFIAGRSLLQRQPRSSSAFTSNTDGTDSDDDDWDGNVSVFYQFNFEYQNTSCAPVIEALQSRLTTVMGNPRRCPFCDQRCSDLYALFQHYRCCHARWSFVIKENSDGITVETRPTQYYDGRLEMRILRKRISKRKVLPVKKTCADTKMLFYRHPKKRYSATGQRLLPRDLDEFKTCPKDFESQEAKSRADFLLLHGRQYYHSQTCQKLLVDEFDKDSEDEMDPEWLREKSQQLIDEFTDVNVGEKTIMKWWNLHVMKYNYFGDSQMALACETFINRYGRNILYEKLINNFLLHLGSLHQFGLLSQSQVLRLTKRLFAMQ